MTGATLISLISVTVGFTVLVLWVYWPSRRERLEALAEIPFDDDNNNRPGEAKGEAQ